MPAEYRISSIARSRRPREVPGVQGLQNAHCLLGGENLWKPPIRQPSSRMNLLYDDEGARQHGTDGGVLASAVPLPARLGQTSVLHLPGRTWGVRQMQKKVDPGQVSQILMNLAANARDAMPQGGKLVIETALAADEGQIRQFCPSLVVLFMTGYTEDGMVILQKPLRAEDLPRQLRKGLDRRVNRSSCNLLGVQEFYSLEGRREDRSITMGRSG